MTLRLAPVPQEAALRHFARHDHPSFCFKTGTAMLQKLSRSHRFMRWMSIRTWPVVLSSKTAYSSA